MGGKVTAFGLPQAVGRAVSSTGGRRRRVLSKESPVAEGEGATVVAGGTVGDATSLRKGQGVIPNRLPQLVGYGVPSAGCGRCVRDPDPHDGLEGKDGADGQEGVDGHDGADGLHAGADGEVGCGWFACDSELIPATIATTAKAQHATKPIRADPGLPLAPSVEP